MFKSVIEFVLIVNWLIASCIKGRGRYYQGNVSTTVSGLQCQRWDSQRPHSHNRPPLHIFPEMQGAENFCRNAGGQEPRPWCYTQDPLVRWQHCHIPQCGTILLLLLLHIFSLPSLFSTLPYFASRIKGCDLYLINEMSLLKSSPFSPCSFLSWVRARLDTGC